MDEEKISKRYRFLDKAYMDVYSKEYCGKKPKECVYFNWACNKKHKNTCCKDYNLINGDIVGKPGVCKLLVDEDCKEFKNGEV